MVVDLAPDIEGLLRMLQRVKTAPVEDLRLECAVEALILAIGLRMVRAAETEADALSDQPDGQVGQLSGLARGAPRLAIVRVDAHRQSIAPEDPGQALTYREVALIVTGLDGQVEA